MTTRLSFAAIALVMSVSAATNGTSNVTFNKDVAPILQKNCQSCHRPGEPAPMALLTYQQVRPWASAIKEAVVLRKMPPWLADPHFGQWSNDRSLAAKDVDTIVRWVETGALEGDSKDAPKPVKFLEGWNIQNPDMILEMPAEYHIPAKGTIDYQYIMVPGKFTKDTWVTAAEVRPGNRAVVHHVIAFVREPGSKWLKDAQPGVPIVPQKGEKGQGEPLVGFAPGFVPEIMGPGRARLIKAGSDIILQMHYTANGKEETDRTRIGLVFTNEPPKERIYTLAAANNKFAIPAGDSNYQVDSEFEVQKDSHIVALLPHMHLRGKDFEYRVKYPDGRVETILKVPHYDFNWQITYYPVNDLVVPAGSVIECTAHFDNSANNAANPDPSQTVRHGDQSWEEMMIGFFNVAIDPHMSPRELAPQKPAPPSQRPTL
jgi:hypothetical protein